MIFLSGSQSHAQTSRAKKVSIFFIALVTPFCNYLPWLGVNIVGTKSF